MFPKPFSTLLMLISVCAVQAQAQTTDPNPGTNSVVYDALLTKQHGWGGRRRASRHTAANASLPAIAVLTFEEDPSSTSTIQTGVFRITVQADTSGMTGDPDTDAAVAQETEVTAEGDWVALSFDGISFWFAIAESDTNFIYMSGLTLDEFLFGDATLTGEFPIESGGYDVLGVVQEAAPPAGDEMGGTGDGMGGTGDGMGGTGDGTGGTGDGTGGTGDGMGGTGDGMGGTGDGMGGTGDGMGGTGDGTGGTGDGMGGTGDGMGGTGDGMGGTGDGTGGTGDGMGGTGDGMGGTGDGMGGTGDGTGGTGDGTGGTGDGMGGAGDGTGGTDPPPEPPQPAMPRTPRTRVS